MFIEYTFRFLRQYQVFKKKKVYHLFVEKLQDLFGINIY